MALDAKADVQIAVLVPFTKCKRDPELGHANLDMIRVRDGDKLCLLSHT